MGPALISYHDQKTPDDITDNQDINILEKSIIDDEIGDSLEYRHLIRRDKHKNTWLNILPMS